MGNYCIRYVNSFNHQLVHYQLQIIIGAFRFPHIQPAMDGCCICRPSGFALVAFCRVCSNPGSVIPHTLHKLRLRCLNGKKAIAAIPNAVQELTSVSILGHEFFASKKHRYCLEPAASVPLLSVYSWLPLNMSLLIANSLLRGTTAFHGSSELDVRVNSWTRAFAVLTRTKNYIIFFEILSHFCIRDI